MSLGWRSLVRRISGSTSRSTSEALPNFNDHRLAYSNKDTKELVRAMFVLKVCSVDFFARNSEKIYWWCHRLLGGKLVNFASRPFYSQFVGGNNEEQMKRAVNKLAQANVRLMVLPQYEEDLGDPDTRNAKYNKNFCRLIDLSELIPRLGGPSSLMQFKTSGVMPAELLVKLSQECALSPSRLELVKKTAEALTGDGSLDCFITFSKEEKRTLQKSFTRINMLVKQCYVNQQRMLVDAEYTYMNPGISLLALALMAVYNQETPLIWNTYQCYLKAAFEDASSDLELSKQLGSCFGAKIVRGAYMYQERDRAKREALPDPVNDTYEDTGKVYDKVANFFLDHIKREGKRCSIVIATHNEDSIRSAISKIRAENLDLSTGSIQFAQIYGMSDQLCVPLAAAGLPVYKSVPFGSTEESLPYLARRAQENKAIMAGARRDIEFMRKELKNRMKRREAVA